MIKDVEIVILFKTRTRNEVRVSFRSKGKIDVCRLARFFGGGGHRTASGCTIRGDLRLVKRLVLAQAKELIRKVK